MQGVFSLLSPSSGDFHGRLLENSGWTGKIIKILRGRLKSPLLDHQRILSLMLLDQRSRLRHFSARLFVPLIG